MQHPRQAAASGAAHPGRWHTPAGAQARTRGNPPAGQRYDRNEATRLLPMSCSIFGDP